MFANLTPLLDTDELIESFQLLRDLRTDYGFTIRHAMNCDVNGENWPLVDLLLDAGIDGFTMAINTHFGGAPLARPDVFQWEGPSGRRVMAYNGWTYDTGWRYGIGRSDQDFAEQWWPKVLERAAQIQYPLPVVMAQSYHPFGDNGPAFEGFVQWIDAWNASGRAPRIILATPAMWWAAVKEHADKLPVYRGDWTDYWNFGATSSAREQTINRASRIRLRTADTVGATLLAAGKDADPWLARSLQLYREQAWHNLILWDEHTWGADISVRLPDDDDTASQWHHKASYAYNARSLSLLLQRDALAALARTVEGAQPDDLLVVNPLPWERIVAGDIKPPHLAPRGTADDTTAGRQFQDHYTNDMGGVISTADDPRDPTEPRTVLPPVKVPAFGYAVVKRGDLATYTPPPSTHESEEAIVETDRYRLVFDREAGGVRSWYDKALNHEWIDAGAGWSFNGFVHEEVADRSHPWPRHLMFYMDWGSAELERPRGWKTGWLARRRPARAVVQHRVVRTPLGVEVIQKLEAPGIHGLLQQSTFIPNYADYVEFRSHWSMTLDPHPESTYVLYPFQAPGAVARFDLGPQATVAGVDQLPGVCRDYFTVQNWVDFSNDHLGVTIATPENPMIQLGDFHFGDNQTDFQLERPMLLGWVTNNYWETNFRAHQPGRVTARYRILPHAGPFDESAAHRFGLEAANDAPLLQHMGEPSSDRTWPAAGTLLNLPQPPVVVLNVKPVAGAPGIVVRLFNASDAEQTATIGSGLVRIVAAHTCDLLENPQSDLPVQDGTVVVRMPARRVAVVQLEVDGQGRG